VIDAFYWVISMADSFFEFSILKTMDLESLSMCKEEVVYLEFVVPGDGLFEMVDFSFFR
jgi:hypothetical protein